MFILLFSEGSNYSYTIADKIVLAYEFSNATLTFKYGYKTFDAAKSCFPSQALLEQFQATIAELQRLNATQRHKKCFTGEIVVKDNVEPLVTDDCDGLNGWL